MGKGRGGFNHRYLTDEVDDNRVVVGMRIPLPYDTRPSCQHDEAIGGFCPNLVKPASPRDGKVCKS